ncbi:MAG: metal ABC transporter permease, partial [Armatimonadota bacterium]|nr:metal ABC transporter permease [Armatimonadota bacterium]
GVFLVLRRMSPIADTLAHVALAGVGAAVLVGMSPAVGALVLTVVGALGVERLRASGQLFGEAALALFLSGGLAVALVLLSLARGLNADLLGYLFGAVTAVTPQDLVWMAGLAVGVCGSVALFYKDLFALTFDEEAARVQGVPTDALNVLLTVLVAVTVVVGMQVVGILLTSALLVVPALTAMRIARSFRGTLALAVAVAAVAVLAGLVASFYLDVAPSGAVVLASIALFAGASWGLRERR